MAGGLKSADPSEVYMRRGALVSLEKKGTEVCISNPGFGFVWLDHEAARTARDWLNANVKD